MCTLVVTWIWRPELYSHVEARLRRQLTNQCLFLRGVHFGWIQINTSRLLLELQGQRNSSFNFVYAKNQHENTWLIRTWLECPKSTVVRHKLAMWKLKSFRWPSLLGMGKDRQTKLTQIAGKQRLSNVNASEREWLVLEHDVKEEELSTSTCFSCADTWRRFGDEAEISLW